eukprot:GHVS01008090.1.p1 GENE.GHVS01008090.1~~GHVS01008090.1.p1  ORF type:complete len:168 (-),score=7.53 GHVS01008090.1:1067-1570(-)
MSFSAGDRLLCRAMAALPTATSPLAVVVTPDGNCDQYPFPVAQFLLKFPNTAYTSCRTMDGPYNLYELGKHEHRLRSSATQRLMTELKTCAPGCAKRYQEVLNRLEADIPTNETSSLLYQQMLSSASVGVRRGIQLKSAGSDHGSFHVTFLLHWQDSYSQVTYLNLN